MAPGAVGRGRSQALRWYVTDPNGVRPESQGAVRTNYGMSYVGPQRQQDHHGWQCQPAAWSDSVRSSEVMKGAGTALTFGQRCCWGCVYVCTKACGL